MDRAFPRAADCISLRLLLCFRNEQPRPFMEVSYVHHPVVTLIRSPFAGSRSCSFTSLRYFLISEYLVGKTSPRFWRKEYETVTTHFAALADQNDARQKYDEERRRIVTSRQSDEASHQNLFGLNFISIKLRGQIST
jgi:hypothetical protein